MAKSAFIRTRIEPELKEHVEKILEKLGLTQTEAIKIFYKQIELYQGLPFEVRIPNTTTEKAIKNSFEGKDQKQFNTADELFKDLRI
jgi:DNA-damage-inducible protein J